MQVDLAVVASVASSVAAMVVTGYVAIARFAIAGEKRRLDDKIAEAAKDAEAAKSATVVQLERFHDREQRITRLEGDLALVRQASGTLGEDVAEMKATMLPRHEWMENARRVDRQLESILVELRRASPGRYPSAQVPAASTPVPPRPDRKGQGPVG